MRSFPILGAVILLGACGGPGSLPIALTASPSSSPPDAMASAAPRMESMRRWGPRRLW